MYVNIFPLDHALSFGIKPDQTGAFSARYSAIGIKGRCFRIAEAAVKERIGRKTYDH